MAKAGIDYFPLNCQLDEKFELIEAQYGLKGFAVVVKLLQRIYGEHGYYCEWNEDIAFLFARQLGLSNGEDGNNLITEVVTASVRRGIFDEYLFKTYGILTSHGIQKRYLEITYKRKEVTVKKEYLLLSDGEIKGNVTILGVSVDENSKNDDRTKQSKGKESKGKETKDISVDPETVPRGAEYEMLMENGELYPIYTNDVKKYRELYPAVDIDQEMRKMIGWLGANPQKRKKPRGMMRFVNGWLSRAQDSAKQSGGTSPVPNKFHNFDQRDTDYDRIVQERTLKWINEQGKKDNERG